MRFGSPLVEEARARREQGNAGKAWQLGSAANLACQKTGVSRRRAAGVGHHPPSARRQAPRAMEDLPGYRWGREVCARVRHCVSFGAYVMRMYEFV